jgi:AcrR family transcriptional regulator
MTATERQLTPHGLDRKAELMAHAEALFLERGFSETRMIDIAKAAGVAKGLVYWYFESKQALFGEIVADIHQRLRSAQADAVAAVDTPLAKIYVGTAASVRFVIEHQRVFALIWEVSNRENLRTATAESARLHAQVAARVLEEGQRLGEVRTDDHPMTMAILNAGVVDRMVGAYAIGVFGQRPSLAAHGAARYVVRAVAVDEAAADRVLAEHGWEATRNK